MTSLPCPPALWTRFSSLLDLAMDEPEAERGPWLERLSGDDAVLRPWLARVLGGDGSMETGFLRERPDPAQDTPFEAGTFVGPYRLSSRLGEGGMGEVWRASRNDEGPQRQVALKLPHPELLGGPFRQRFARERDVLAALSHPHIAQLYDAGLSADGHPYLALELVEGQPITEACRAERASLHRRVELVREVLEALTYAHQRLIVHRDIKPSNVLVTPEGGVKLLDFGIAKLLRPADPQDVRLTQVSARLATPAYAAPEQFCDGAITVTTDIYSAGVLLFELCTGHRPFAAPPTGPAPREAPLASQRADEAAAGIHEPANLARALHGDLDAIIAKSLAINQQDRYGSAEAFARDLGRWRENLPVSARRVGWATLGAKFARRNKAGVALAAVLALALAGGTAGIAWQARIAARAAARAEHEAARANAVKNYLISLFEQGDPHNGGKPSETMTAKELLDRGTDHADAVFAGQPETEIELLETLQRIYSGEEDSVRARQVGMRRLELARSLYGPADARVVDGTMDMVTNSIFFLDRETARGLLEKIRDPVITHDGPTSLQRAKWLMAWSDTLRATHGGRDAALAAGQQAVALFQKYYPNDAGYVDALYILAGYQYDAEQYAQSLATLNQERKVEVAQGSGDVLNELSEDIQAGNTLRHLGRHAEAAALFEKAQARADKVVGRQSMWYLASLTNRAALANSDGNRDAAMAIFAQANAIAVGKAAASGQVSALRRAYGGALAADGDPAAAIPLLEYALQQTQLHPKDESNLRNSEGYLGDAYDQAGRAGEARALLQTARDDWVRYGVPNGAFTLGGRERWARFLLEHGDAAAARAECGEILRLAAGTPLAPAALAQADLARISLSQGDTASADRLSAQALQTIDAALQDYDVRVRTDIWLTRAETLLAHGQKQQAADLAGRALAAAQASDLPGSKRLARATELVRKAQS